MLLKLLIASLAVARVRCEGISLTEEELLAYDGTDSSKPIYLAIDGSIYDVSTSPAFYGPGGNYHHFVGRDATRAWVTECWDSPDQLTWRMDGVLDMFTPRYLDEELEGAAQGKEINLDLGGVIPQAQIIALAEAAMARVGAVSEEDKSARRAEDQAEAQKQVDEALVHWVGFFANNSKYKRVGTVVLNSEATPSPPALCAAALKKRQLKGGKLDSLMSIADMGRKSDGSGKQKPDFANADVHQAKSALNSDGDQVKDEL